MAEPLLDVQHLSVHVGGPSPAVDDVSFRDKHRRDARPGWRIRQRQIGDGIFHPASAAAARANHRRTRHVQGRDLLTLAEREMREVRGAEISLIFQEPMTALNPVLRVGDQIAEALLVHGKATRAEARARAVELLEAVKIPTRRAASAIIRISCPAACGSAS